MRGAQHTPTNPDAIPLLDGWGWGDYWSASEWMTWHRAMAARYGTPYANANFLTYWHQQSFGSAPLDARTFDTAFRDYAKAQGFFDGLFSGAENVLRPVGTVINDVPRAVDATLSITTAILPALILGGVVWYFWPVIRRVAAARPSA